MVDAVLIPDELLAPHLEEARRRTRTLDPPLAFDLDAPVWGGALARYLLLTEWPELLHEHALPKDSLSYSSYYWLTRFAAARALTHGPDAGLEQLRFELLAQAPVELDWELVEAIDARASSEASVPA